MPDNAPTTNAAGATQPAKLDAFTRAYIQTALWATTDDQGEPLDRNHDARSLAPSALATIAADCAKFQTENSEAIAAAIETGNVKCGPDFDATERAGHDFFLTRNRHGAGFWDGDWPEPFAQTLTDAAHTFSESQPYPGDDGKLYV